MKHKSTRVNFTNGDETLRMRKLSRLPTYRNKVRQINLNYMRFNKMYCTCVRKIYIKVLRFTITFLRAIYSYFKINLMYHKRVKLATTVNT